MINPLDYLHNPVHCVHNVKQKVIYDKRNSKQNHIQTVTPYAFVSASLLVHVCLVHKVILYKSQT